MQHDAALTVATFGAVWAILSAGHNLADHVLSQTDNLVSHKGAPAPAAVAAGANPHAGWAACWAHVALYHLVVGVMIVVAWAALPLTLTWPGLVAGLGFSAITHAVIDRRWPVRWLLEHTGSAEFARLANCGINGMYLADQALHAAALFVSALLITRL
jgi:hypothetical protein